MHKHQLYINLFTITSVLAFSACTEEVVYVVQSPDTPEVVEKTPIELTSTVSQNGGDMSITRASFVDGKGKKAAFEKNTRVHFLFVSENATNSSDKKYSETYGTAVGSGKSFSQLDADHSNWTATEKESKILFTGQTDNQNNGIMRYWDDAHARNSKLSVYGFTNVFASNPTGAPWFPRLDRKSASNDGSTESHQFPEMWKVYDEAMGTFIGATDGKWTVGVYNGQSDASNYLFQSKISLLSKDDIAYSNNLSGDACLKFDTNKKFTTGVAEFHRAMAMLTINIVAGEGFDISAGQFKFSEDSNIAMNGWNKKGFLNIKTGAWDDIETGNWSKIDNTNDDREGADKGKPYYAANQHYYTLMAFVIPGNDISSETTNDALQFTIDGSIYKVSKKMLYDAIKGNSSNCDNGIVKDAVLTEGKKIKAGINYEFTFTIGKSKIQNITAQLIDWETVIAEPQNFNNARIKLQLEERGIPQTSDVAFYSMTDNNTGEFNDNYTSYNWKSGYSNMGATYSSDHWTTDKYWHSSNEFYHFRALMPQPTAVTTDATNGDYVTLTSGSTYTDVCWGAPMKDDADDETPGSFQWNYGPEKNGFDGKDVIDFTQADNADKHQIYKAIGATENPIKLILFHMMSNVTFKVKTTTTDNKVDLGNGPGTNVTKIELRRVHTQGKLFMGNGRVVGCTENVGNSNYTFTQTPALLGGVITWNYGAIPQSLQGEVASPDDDVKLVITTPDNNQYIVDLWKVSAAITTSNIANPYGQIDEEDSGKFLIDAWYPGFKYVYTFTLSKTGITDMQATIVDWETIEADDDPVQIQ